MTTMSNSGWVIKMAKRKAALAMKDPDVSLDSTAIGPIEEREDRPSASSDEMKLDPISIDLKDNKKKSEYEEEAGYDDRKPAKYKSLMRMAK